MYKVEKTFFSILIPVYNVEKYVAQCLESVLSQDYDNYEIIIIIDGATDSSALICEDFAERDQRIKLVYQENKGLLIARRNLLKHVNGEYVLFLDSDDFWENNEWFFRRQPVMPEC